MAQREKETKYFAVTALTTATGVVDENPIRKFLIITNNSAKTVYFGTDKRVTVSSGMPLYTNTSYIIRATNMYKGPIFAITEAGTANLRVMEFSIY